VTAERKPKPRKVTRAEHLDGLRFTILAAALAFLTAALVLYGVVAAMEHKERRELASPAA
jgi:hypothetical protein